MWTIAYEKLLMEKAEKIAALKIAGTYVTMIIGAGFASGQEIFTFFTRYFTGGFPGILLAAGILSLSGGVILYLVHKLQIKDGGEFLREIMSGRVALAVNIVIGVFSLIILGAMFSGISDLFIPKLTNTTNNTNLELSNSINFIAVDFLIKLILVILFTCILCVKTEFIIRVAYWFSPLLAVVSFFAGIYLVMNGTEAAECSGALTMIIPFTSSSFSNRYSTLWNHATGWILPAVLYAGYNLTIAFGLLCKSGSLLYNKKAAISGGVGGGAVLALCAIFINTGLVLFSKNVNIGELPVPGVLTLLNDGLADGYVLFIGFAMFSTAACSGISASEVLKQIAGKLVEKKESIVTKISIAFLICSIGVLLSNIRFGRIISDIYPFFGIPGIFILAAALLKYRSL